MQNCAKIAKLCGLFRNVNAFSRQYNNVWTCYIDEPNNNSKIRKTPQQSLSNPVTIQPKKSPNVTCLFRKFGATLLVKNSLSRTAHNHKIDTKYGSIETGLFILIRRWIFLDPRAIKTCTPPPQPNFIFYSFHFISNCFSFLFLF